MEIWKYIKDTNNLYQISDKGRIKSFCVDKNGIIFNRKFPKGEYCRVQLWVNGKRLDKRVHRLVAEHFLPISKLSGRICINHKDNNKHNNDVSNLEWTTYSGNWQHYVDNFSTILGENHPNAKLTNNNFIEILQSKESGVSLAKKFGVNHSTINRIRRNEAWKHCLSAQERKRD